jgi:hypothetical protein
MASTARIHAFSGVSIRGDAEQARRLRVLASAPMTPSSRRILLSVAVASLSAASLTASLGCGGGALANLRKRAAHDLDCPQESLVTTNLGAGAWGVDGCGQSATYVLVGSASVPGSRHWVMNSVSQPAPAAPAPAAAPAAPAVAATVEPAAWTKPIHSSRDIDNQVVWNAQLPLQGTDLALTVQGTPARDPAAVMLGLARHAQPPVLRDCELKLVANGELLALPAKEPLNDPGVDRLYVKLPLAGLEKMAAAQRVVGQVCTTRFELAKDELAVLSDFLLRFREELALSGTSGGTAAR